MIVSSHKQPDASPRLINFLQQKVGLSEKAISLGVRQAEIEQAPLPIILWSFGLLSLNQYEHVLEWERENQ